LSSKIRIKKNLKNFTAYEPDEIDYLFRLNANESPFDETKTILARLSKTKNRNYLKTNSVNRYPDPSQNQLRKKVSKFHGINQNQIIFGNGSDELILYLLLALTGKTTNIIHLNPSFSMYKILSSATGNNPIKVNLDSNFQIDINDMLTKIKKYNPDLIFIPTPNNPTGNSFRQEDIKKIIKSTKGLVVIDEAYADYSSHSYLPMLKRNKNLLIMKTMSKVGFASLRLGYLIGNSKIISEINKIRLPYNISTLSQLIACDYFDNQKSIKRKIQIIKSERTRLVKFLQDKTNFEVYPTDSNFILIRTTKSKSLNNFLKTQSIILRSFNSNKELKNCLRITVGSPKENNKLIRAISAFIVK
tara:strand:- start:80057 stop:81133 length:1077 start_codon:yes stop_codon:yes gene_type:complete